jgi:DNA-binding CsgD family transcriptional regulator
MKQNCADVVSRFYDANLNLAKWEQALFALRDLSEADICFIASHDVEKKSGTILHSVGFEELTTPAHLKNRRISDIWYSDNNDQYKYLIEHDNRGVDRSKSKSIVYRNYQTPLGAGDILSLIITKDKKEILYVLCVRLKERGPFPEKIIEEIDSIFPHVCRSFDAGHLRSKNEIFEKVSMSVLDAMPIGIALLNYKGFILSTNKSAKSVIDEGDIFAVSNNGLVLDKNGDRLKLVDLIESLNGGNGCIESTDVVAFSIPRMSGKRPITVMLTKQIHGIHDQDIPIATLYIGDPDHAYHFDAAHLCRLYGLSRAEGRVAALIASGYRLEEISDALGIAYETVRKHIKQIFGKTGTSRQAELVRVMITGPSIIPS